MSKLSGQLTARLADENEVYERRLIDEINNRVNPPEPLTADDVHIRAMYIVSDTINSQGGKFEEPELDGLVAMMPDAPVLVGHKRDSLPVARNFHAVKVEEEGRIWVKSYFYWLKDSEGAEDLRQKIDGGIYKECSISFIFHRPECSVCGEDIRRCSHIPFQEYDVAGSSHIAHFTYRQIERVLETSLVFRGAIPDTRITNKLASMGEKRDAADTTECLETLFSKESPDNTASNGRQSYRDARISIFSLDAPPVMIPGISLFYPYQPGIVVRVRKSNDQVDIATPVLFSKAIHNHFVNLIKGIDMDSCRFDAVVYAVRGKNRLDGFGLMKCLDGNSQCHRLRMKVMDAVALGEMSYESVNIITRQRILRDNRLAFMNAGLDVVRPELIDKNANLSERLAEYRGKYRFGGELLFSLQGKMLHRVICTNGKTVPAVVEGVYSGKETQTVCHVSVPGDAGPVNVVPVRLGKGLAEGVVVLASVQGKANRISSIHDILPGTDVERLDLPGQKSDEKEVRFLHDDKNLHVYFDVNGGVRTATVYQFGERLFSNGRRFVADISTTEDEMPECRFGDRIQAKSISEINGMYVIRLSRPLADSGRVTGMVFRPVLIDGVERYLCYSPEFSHLPEE